MRENGVDMKTRTRRTLIRATQMAALISLAISGVPNKSMAANDAKGVALLPAEIALNHKDATQRLVVEEIAGDKLVGDLTAKAKFVSSDPAVAVVDEKGIVRAVGDGTAVITAETNGQKSEAKIKVQGTTQPFHWSFPLHVQPVLYKAGCNTGACHGAAAGKNGFKLSLRGYDHEWDNAVLTRQANGRRISLAEPEESLILLKPTQAVKHGGGERFDKNSEEYRRIVEWIRDGAPSADPNEPKIDRIEVTPQAITLKKGNDQQVLVRAYYSDGNTEDVTHWVKFGTTDESVALVDDEGKVTVKGSGAVAITAWYSSKVAFARLTVPREKMLAPEIFAKAARKNFVDDLVLKQLESLQIAPASSCSDTEFIRRASLDATGVLPTPEEVYRFTMETGADKRAKLIDRLLDRAEFADYWAYKWSDIFLLSSKKIPRREDLSAFYRFIHDSVKDNKPWDQFAREIITAKGSTTENGATNYFVIHKETTELTETTSQAFLGMSITCARCHNHPLEKWTQDDYYGMANLLSRVKLKNAEGNKGTIVLAGNFGDILHPRLGKAVPPKPLDAAPIALDAPGDRRETLAKWLTSPENPYFTRAIVNRVWRNFMGRGLVEPEDDLRLTNPPSNEELFAALTKDLIEHKYDLKQLMRTIMNSAAYQRSSAPSDPAAPDGKYYSQYIIRRLSAEVILDAYSQATGVATSFPGYPAGFRAIQLPDSQVGSYFLTAFGRPQRVQTCSCERTEATSVAQTLHVANGETLNNKLKDDQSVVAELASGKKSDQGIVEDLYIRSLTRYPTDKELGEATAVLASVPRGDSDAAKKSRREAIEDMAWAILSSKEFMFNH